MDFCHNLEQLNGYKQSSQNIIWHILAQINILIILIYV